MNPITTVATFPIINPDDLSSGIVIFCTILATSLRGALVKVIPRCISGKERDSPAASATHVKPMFVSLRRDYLATNTLYMLGCCC